jgi:hypothetical protein
VKCDAQGNEIARFSRPDLGVPDRINVYDPMRILLHYTGFNQIVLLDNRLNPIMEPINLFELGLVDVPCVAIADENFLWLYDQASDRLIKLNMREMKITFRTPPITQLLGLENQPLRIRTNVRGLFILMEEGLAAFDAMGNFIGFTPLVGLNDIHLRKDDWLASKGLKLYSSKDQNRIPLPKCEHWTLDNENLIYSSDKRVFSIPLLP